jgi:hypothetical protein
MNRPPHVDPQLAALVREAARVPMTPEARERQLQSFAYGNVKLEDDRVSRAQVTAQPDRSERR